MTVNFYWLGINIPKGDRQVSKKSEGDTGQTSESCSCSDQVTLQSCTKESVLADTSPLGSVRCLPVRH